MGNFCFTVLASLTTCLFGSASEPSCCGRGTCGAISSHAALASMRSGGARGGNGSSSFDIIEMSAHTDYMKARCSLWAKFFLQDKIPGRRSQCGNA